MVGYVLGAPFVLLLCEVLVSVAYVVDAVRTPSGKGKPGGALSSVHPVELHAGVLRALVDRSGLDPAVLDDVISGVVGQVGEQSLNAARWAVLAAGFPDTVPGTTVDRQCGSSQQAVHFAAQGILAGSYDLVLASGVESMSRVPMGSSTLSQDPFGPSVKARYPVLVPQGISAELIAQRWGFSRVELDEYAASSHQLGADAVKDGHLAASLLPVRTEAGLVEVDETLRPGTTVESLAALRPAFRSEFWEGLFPDLPWVVTPGNSSPLTDAASGVLLASEGAVSRYGLTPRARLHSFSVVGDDPVLMLTGIVPATRKVLARAGLSLHDIDVFEVNEAFAPVVLAWMHDLGVERSRVNPLGGAIALGHALGASGTRLLGSLLTALEVSGGRYGLQTMCEGGGTANALVLERLGP